MACICGTSMVESAASSFGSAERHKGSRCRIDTGKLLTQLEQECGKGWHQAMETELGRDR